MKNRGDGASLADWDDLLPLAPHFLQGFSAGIIANLLCDRFYANTATVPIILSLLTYPHT